MDMDPTLEQILTRLYKREVEIDQLERAAGQRDARIKALEERIAALSDPAAAVVEPAPKPGKAIPPGIVLG